MKRIVWDCEKIAPNLESNELRELSLGMTSIDSSFFPIIDLANDAHYQQSNLYLNTFT